MTATGVAASEREERFNEVVAAYLEAVEAGQPDHRWELVARYPDLADDLEKFFADQDGLHHLAAPLRLVATAGVPSESRRAGTDHGQVGDFRIVREIGRGGMGVVYEAEQISLGRKVALKVLPFASALDSKQLQRFKNEAQAAAQLHHTNIVPVYAVGSERGVHYYAMQFIEGQTLAAMIHDLRRVEGRTQRQVGVESSNPRQAAKDRGFEDSSPATAIVDTPTVAAISTVHSTKDPAFFRTVTGLGIQAAEALEHAHQMCVVHRDIKPGNLLVDVRGNLWIADFGLARLGTDPGLTMSGDLLGTLRYMSPEQALAKRVIVDHRTDIYSLGVTLYEVLTLRPAFPGKDRQEIMRQIAFEEPKPPRGINKAIPPELETIVLKAMSKSPAERYATAAEVADDLRRFLENKPIWAKRPGVVQRLRKFTRRHEITVRAAVVTAFIGLIMTSLTFGVGMFNVKAEQEKTKAELRITIDAKSNMNLLLRLARGFLAEQVHRPRTAQGLLALTVDYLRDWPSEFKDRETLRLPRHAKQCSGVAWSPDGRLLATGQGYYDGTVTIWDAATGKELQKFQYPGGTGVVTFSPDGRRIACSALRCFAVRDLAAGHTVFTRPEPEARAGGALAVVVGEFAAAFSPDGRRIAGAGSSGTVWVSDTLAAAPERIDLNLDQDPKRLATVRSARRYLVAEELLRLEGHFAVAWSHDGRYIASGVQLPGRELETVVKLYDAGSGREAMTLHQVLGVITCLAFSPDGRYLASADSHGAVIVSDLTTGNLSTSFSARLGPSSVSDAFFSSARVLMGGGYPHGLLPDHVWQMIVVNCLVYSPDGRYIATAGLDGIVSIWSTRFEYPGKLVASIDGRMGPVFGLAFSPQGERLAAAGGFQDQGIVKIWDSKLWEK